MKASKLVFSSFNQLFLLPPDQISKMGQEKHIPSFCAETIKSLLTESKEIFMNESSLIETSRNVVIVGDIYGNIYDLMRIFAVNGLPPKTKYIFLGNYVDFGDYQLECLCLLLSLHNLHPESFHLLHGSHEFSQINERQGFFNVILDTFKSYEIWQLFNETFSLMPLAAVVDKEIFCVHSGISPNLLSLNQIRSIERPIDEKTYEIVNCLMNAEPVDDNIEFKQSNKQNVMLYGLEGTKNFLINNNLKGVIRSHKFVENGIERMQNGLVITIFSYSNVVNKSKGGYIYIDETVEYKYLDPIKFIAKSDALFFNVVPQLEAFPLLSSSRVLKIPNRYQGRCSLGLISSSSLFKRKRQVLQRSCVIVQPKCTIVVPQ